MYEFLDAGFFPQYYLSDRFTITVNNASSQTQTVNVFNPFPPIKGVTVSTDSLSAIVGGSSKSGSSTPTPGPPPGPKQGSSSMEGLFNRIIGEPFKVKAMKIVAPEEQLNNMMKLVYLDAAGKYRQTVFAPSQFSNSFMSRPNTIDIPDMNLAVDVNSSLEIVINPNTTMRLIFLGMQGANDEQTFKNFMEIAEQRGYRNFMKQIA